MAVITCIDDLKTLYQRRVPKMFYDYAESGSWTEQTFRENSSDFSELRLRQRIAVDIAKRSTADKMLGQDVTMPVALAPVGMLGMQCADGEIKAARAAEDFGVPFCLSTMSICSIEDVAENTSAPFWLQVYTLNDDDYMRRLMQRARDAKCSAIVITVDLQLLGQRHKDLKNGLSAPPKPTLTNMVNLATKLQWCKGMLGTKRRTFGNIVGHVDGVADPSSIMEWTHEKFDQSLNWDRIAQLMDMWGGKVILKGIMDPADARRAADLGVDAIIVSNHGGRQLDGTLSAIRGLPAIVDAVGNRCEIWMDSGIRSGQDVLKAKAMGATGTMIGRAMVYGLGAMGEDGVTKALELIHKELSISMALCGRTELSEVDRDILMIPKGFDGDWQETRLVRRKKIRGGPKDAPMRATGWR